MHNKTKNQSVQTKRQKILKNRNVPLKKQEQYMTKDNQKCMEEFNTNSI